MWFGGVLIGLALGMWIERAFAWNAARLQRKLDALNREVAEIEARRGVGP